mgnify:CR=1 FL=1
MDFLGAWLEKINKLVEHEDFAKIKVPVPPLEEQSKIVKEFSIGLESELRGLVSVLEEKKINLMFKALTGKLYIQ